MKAKRVVQSEPQGLRLQCNFYCFLQYLYGNAFVLCALYPFFSSLADACEHTHTRKQTVTTFHIAFASARKGISNSYKGCGRTVELLCVSPDLVLGDAILPSALPHLPCSSS